PPSNDRVQLSWQITPTVDLNGFRVQRTTNLSNTLEGSACAFDFCWKDIANVPGTTLAFVDSDLLLDTARWYRIQAVDSSGNRSFFAGPVQAIIHNLTPPNPPTLKDTECRPGQWCVL